MAPTVSRSASVAGRMISDGCTPALSRARRSGAHGRPGTLASAGACHPNRERRRLDRRPLRARLPSSPTRSPSTSEASSRWVRPRGHSWPTRVIDAHGAFVCSAFRDGHVHAISGGFERAIAPVRDHATPQEIAAAVGRWAAEHPEVEWVRGEGFDHTLAPGGVFLAEWLDAEVPDRPVVLRATRLPHGVGQLRGACAAPGTPPRRRSRTTGRSCATTTARPSARCASGAPGVPSTTSCRR